jgi:hypothetical protein
MRKRKCEVEMLESRRLLSVTAASLAFPLTQGNSWTTKNTSDGTIDTFTVGNVTTFNGQSASTYQDVSTSTGNPSTKTTGYFGFDRAGDFVTFGAMSVSTDTTVTPNVTTTTTETYTTPRILFPATAVAGTVYKFTSPIQVQQVKSPGGTTNFTGSEAYSIELVSDTTKPITVPARSTSFNCYTLLRTDTLTALGHTLPEDSSTDYEAPGFFPIESIDNTDSTTTVLTGFSSKQTATKLGFGTPPTEAVVNAVMSPAVKVDVEDSTGSTVTSNTSTVTLSEVSGPSGGISGTLTAAAVNGVATFSALKFTKAGTYTIKATDGSLTSVTSQMFQISAPVTSTKLEFDKQPAPQTAGKTLPPVSVDLETAGGVLNIGDTSNVTLSIASGPAGAKLGGTLTEAAEKGVATFNDLVLTTPGEYTLKATSGSLTSATSDQFLISGILTATKLAITPPEGTVAGIETFVFVSVESSTGAIVTTDQSKVTLSLVSGPGTMTGTLSINAIDGRADFSNIVFSKAGTYNVKATDGSLTSASTGNFTVTAPLVASKLAFAATPATTAAGKSITPSVLVEIENSSGTVINTATSAVTIAIASGTGTLSGTKTVNAIGGVATFSNLSLNKVGTFTLKATDGTLTSATSGSFKITAATASKLVIANTPATTVAGKAISPAVVVDIEDAFGNIITTNTSNVTFAVASGGGTLTGTATVAAKAGVATFSNLILTKSGAHTLKATDGTLTSATSGSFSITPAAALKLIFAAAVPTATAGKAITPAVLVDVEDQFGNIVTTNTSNVTLSLNTAPTGATIGGTVTVAAKAGVATFSNVLLNKAGTTYSLKAADSALVVAKSSTFKVVAAAAKKLAFVNPPKSATHGVTLPTVTVAVEDSFGNVVTTDTSKLTFALVSGPSGGVLSGTLTEPAVAGIAMFSTLKFSKVGTYQIKVTDGVLTDVTASATVS